MTLAGKPKEDSSTSTPDPTITPNPTMEEILVEGAVQAVETDDGFLIFQADERVFEPPVLINKERFLELFVQGNLSKPGEG